MIDMQKLAYYVGIIDNDLILSKASKELNISQPSLSLTIDYLEELFDEKLLIKEKNKFTQMTPAGKELYFRAKKLIEDANQIKIDLENSNYVSGQLSIAIPPVTQPIVAKEVITLFKKQYPNIQLDIYEEGAFIAKEKLYNHQLDFGMMTVFMTENQLESFEIYESDVVCMMHKNHPLAKKDYVSVNDISKQEVIGLNDTFTLYRMIDVYFNNHGSRVNYFQTTSRWDYAVEIVSNNPQFNFVSILPVPLLEIYNNKDIITKEFNHPFKWTVNLSYNKYMLLKQEHLLFIEFVKNFFNVNK